MGPELLYRLLFGVDRCSDFATVGQSAKQRPAMLSDARDQGPRVDFFMRYGDVLMRRGPVFSCSGPGPEPPAPRRARRPPCCAASPGAARIPARMRRQLLLAGLLLLLATFAAQAQTEARQASQGRAHGLPAAPGGRGTPRASGRADRGPGPAGARGPAVARRHRGGLDRGRHADRSGRKPPAHDPRRG